jgi:hypothetical protein
VPQQWGLPPTPRVSALPCGPHGARPAQGPGPPQRPQRTAGALGIPQPTLLGQDTVASMWSDDPVTWHCTCTLPSRSNPLAQPHVESYPQHPGCCGRSVLPAPGNITAWRADGHCVKGVELPPPPPPPTRELPATRPHLNERWPNRYASPAALREGHKKVSDPARHARSGRRQGHSEACKLPVREWHSAGVRWRNSGLCGRDRVPARCRPLPALAAGQQCL